MSPRDPLDRSGPTPQEAFHGRRPAGRWFVGCLIVAVLAGTLAGCGGRRRSPARAAVRTAGETAKDAQPARQSMSREVRERILEGAMDVLGNLETYEEPVAFAQVFDRLNQWSHAAGDADDSDGGDERGWRLDPLLETLPERLRAGPATRGIEGMAFDAATDVVALRDQRWLADVSTAARGDAIEDLDVAGKLFDWTVRALAIGSDPPMVPGDSNPGSRWFFPGEVLLAGRASAPQRAWVFLELVRHAGLEGVMLATGDAAGENWRPWIPAVISGGEAYLFEPGYGLPVPGPGGEGVATARQAAADPSILASLSLPDRPYPVQASDIARLGVLVPATPTSLARRMHHLDRQLAGTRRIDLSLDADALAERALAALPAAEGPAATRRKGLWEFPWETIARRRSRAADVDRALAKELRPFALAVAQGGEGRGERMFRPLYAGRLREFRGQCDGPDGAKMAYLAARPTNASIADVLRGAPSPQADELKRAYEELKADATYWLGLLTLAEGEYETAADYLGRMTLEANPDGIWADAARVNLARARLGLGDREEAARLLRADESPQRFGSRILADRVAPRAE